MRIEEHMHGSNRKKGNLFAASYDTIYARCIHQRRVSNSIGFVFVGQTPLMSAKVIMFHFLTGLAYMA